jgi:type IX secretion system PorP/SprF family membrane protein
MYNTVVINPAYAGSRGTTNIFALHRTQWVGLEGAPTTNAVSVNMAVDGTNLGIGLSIVNDKIGPSDENNLAIDLSYSIPTSERYKLSFGLKASANLLNVDFNRVSQYNSNDFAFETNINNKFSPNVGVGFYLHSEESYIGISVPSLLETKHFDRYVTGANSHIATENMNLYLIGGIVYDLSYNVKFKPSFFAKYVQGAPLQVDISTNFMFNDKFVGGVAYRWSAAVSAMAGFKVNDQWFIGYSYDFDTTRLANYNSGSHELFLRYELFNRATRVICPRFF